MSDSNHKIKWKITSNTTYQAEAYRTVTYTAVITKTANAHALVVNPGAVAVGTYDTLKKAKSAFRHYLSDK